MIFDCHDTGASTDATAAASLLQLEVAGTNVTKYNFHIIQLGLGAIYA